MLFHDEVGFFPHSGQLGLFCLLESVSLSINLGDSFEDGGEVPSSEMLHLMELVHSLKVLFLGSTCGSVAIFGTL